MKDSDYQDKKNQIIRLIKEAAGGTEARINLSPQGSTTSGFPPGSNPDR